jgi:hypothetical protein
MRVVFHILAYGGLFRELDGRLRAGLKKVARVQGLGQKPVTVLGVEEACDAPCVTRFHGVRSRRCGSIWGWHRDKIPTPMVAVKPR